MKFDNGSGDISTVENVRPSGAAGFLESANALYQGKTKEDANKTLQLIATHAGTKGCINEAGDSFPYEGAVVVGNELFLGCCR
jgi:hypothetical protein